MFLLLLLVVKGTFGLDCDDNVVISAAGVETVIIETETTEKKKEKRMS